jgi:hypothetical protein
MILCRERGGREKAMAEPLHTYPPGYGPGPEAPWAVNEAWGILDMLHPGTLDLETRAFLAGCICGTLVRLRARLEGEGDAGTAPARAGHAP